MYSSYSSELPQWPNFQVSLKFIINAVMRKANVNKERFNYDSRL